MTYTNTQTLSRKRARPNKLIIGFLAAAITAFVGTAGVANAAPVGKPTKAECTQAGFSNYGQCVKAWALSHGGHGYGGNIGIDIDINIDIDIIGDGNTIIIRFS